MRSSGRGPGAPDTPEARRAAAVDRLRRAGCVFAVEEAAALGAAFPAAAALELAVRRRESGELIEHILGTSRFCGARLEVDPGVFVPRTRAEPLAWLAAAEVGRRGAGASVLDLGCGCGAIAAAVKRANPGAEVIASDVSPDAVEAARRNGARYGFEVCRADWFAGLPQRLSGRLDVVLAYLPHTPDRSIATLPRDRVAGEGLDSFAGGGDGLDPLRTVLAGLPGWLAPAGVFLTLVAIEQAEAATGAAGRGGWVCSTTTTRDDDTVVAVTRPQT